MVLSCLVSRVAESLSDCAPGSCVAWFAKSLELEFRVKWIKIEWVTGSFGASELQLEGTQAGQMGENVCSTVGSLTEPREAHRPTVSVFMHMDTLGGWMGAAR